MAPVAEAFVEDALRVTLSSSRAYGEPLEPAAIDGLCSGLRTLLAPPCTAASVVARVREAQAAVVMHEFLRALVYGECESASLWDDDEQTPSSKSKSATHALAHRSAVAAQAERCARLAGP